MSKFRYAVSNGKNHIGSIWEGENGTLMYVPVELKIDLNYDIEIKDVDTYEYVAVIDLRDLILNTIKPQKENYNSNITINLNIEKSTNAEDVFKAISESMKNVGVKI